MKQRMVPAGISMHPDLIVDVDDLVKHIGETTSLSVSRSSVVALLVEMSMRLFPIMATDWSQHDGLLSTEEKILVNKLIELMHQQ